MAVELARLDHPPDPGHDRPGYLALLVAPERALRIVSTGLKNPQRVKLKTYTGLDKRVVPRLRELLPRGQRESHNLGPTL